jgi:hypothetical protein
MDDHARQRRENAARPLLGQGAGGSLSSARPAHQHRIGVVMSEYPASRLALRMAVLIRMTERGLTREELADLTGLTPLTVLEVYLHTPAELARLAVALGWPTDYFDYSAALRPPRPGYRRHP